MLQIRRIIVIPQLIARRTTHAYTHTNLVTQPMQHVPLQTAHAAHSPGSLCSTCPCSTCPHSFCAKPGMQPLQRLREASRDATAKLTWESSAPKIEKVCGRGAVDADKAKQSRQRLKRFLRPRGGRWPQILAPAAGFLVDVGRWW